MIAGVAGGLASYLGIDPVLVRIGFVAAAALGGFGLTAYIIAWIAIPEAPYGDAPAGPASAASNRVVLLFGVSLVTIGTALLIGWIIPFRIFMPLAVIGVGVGLMVTAWSRS